MIEHLKFKFRCPLRLPDLAPDQPKLPVEISDLDPHLISYLMVRHIRDDPEGVCFGLPGT